jgi:uncharacterized membrane protein YeaQ/YmgE (transglycosylase-associated protein family)
MSILGWILVGLIAGFLARAVVGDDGKGQGCLYTLVVGVLGALVGGGLFSWAAGVDDPLDGFNLGSLVVAFVGACLLLLVLQAISRRPRR